MPIHQSRVAGNDVLLRSCRKAQPVIVASLAQWKEVGRTWVSHDRDWTGRCAGLSGLCGMSHFPCGTKAIRSAAKCANESWNAQRPTRGPGVHKPADQEAVVRIALGTIRMNARRRQR